MEAADPLAPIQATLDAEGLFFNREDDNEAMRLAFKSEGERYFVVTYREDPEFLMLGSAWVLPPDVELGDALETANAMNARKKFVKTSIWPGERDVLFTIELCLDDFEDFGEHFVRYLDALRDTATDFLDSLRAP